MTTWYRTILSIFLMSLTAGTVMASVVMEVKALTDTIILMHWTDGHVVHSTAGQAYGEERLVQVPLDTLAATRTASYRLTSTNDLDYATSQQPIQIGRKSKGTDFAWLGGSNWTLEHWLYLELPKAMKQGATYVVDTGSLADNGRQWTLTFDEGSTRSEAVHVNLLGYVPDAPGKFAYVHHWMGDLGGLNLSAYGGHDFRLINLQTGKDSFSGTLKFRHASTTPETGQLNDSVHGNFLGADVYECDFSSFQTPGRYVVSVEGIGCSFPFQIAGDVYREAFYKVVRGLYHNRSGLELTTNCTRWPRSAPHNPLLTPGFAQKLFYTTNRFVEWGSEGGSAGQLTNAHSFKGFLNSAGWYQDAGDWDSYYSHLTVPQMLLFAYEVAPRNFYDGELHLPEGINGLPDILDEAAWLPRFLYRLRHEYSRQASVPLGR